MKFPSFCKRCTRSSRKYHLTEDEIEHEIKLCRKRATILRRSDGVKLILSLLTQNEIDTVTAHGSDDSEVAGHECFHYHGSKQTSYNCRVIIVALQIVVFGKSNGKSTYLRIPLVHLEQVYRGHSHPFWQKNGTNEEVCLSLTYLDKGLHEKVEHFAFENGSIRDIFADVLDKLVDARDNKLTQSDKMAMISDHERYLLFSKYDKDKSDSIDQKELKKILKELQIECKESQIRATLLDLNLMSKTLTFDEFTQLYKALTHRKDLELLFSSVTNGENVMSIKDLHHFLLTEQHETSLTLESCQNLVQKYATSFTQTINQQPDTESAPPTAPLLTSIKFAGFEKILTCEEFGNFNDQTTLEFNESTMDNPITDYYISSSHNTYLSGHQLYGESKVEMYAETLRKNCRCVELDCWDSSDGSHPIIYHGYTKTTKIKFKDVIECINENAFVTSEYPVILSIENHCNVKNQSKMAQIMKDIFGEKLITELVDGLNCPTPNMLKNRIIVKAKKLPEDEAALLENVEAEDCIEVSDDEDETENSDSDKNYKKKAEVKLSPELSQMIIYNRARHFKDFREAKETSTCHHISSFVETKVQKLGGDYLGFVAHTNFQMVRTYPAGKRVGSDNYDPVVPWALGCQVVALNWQTHDTSQLINTSHFKMNGGKGWVLKPENIRKRMPWSSNIKNLWIKVISANQLPRGTDKNDVVDPYVSFDLYDYNPGNVKVDKGFVNQKTRRIKNNGWNPEWNTEEDEFDFDSVNADSAFLVIKVKDQDKYGADDDLGRKVVPLKSIKTGYRHVFLEDKQGVKISFANVLLHVKWK